MCPELQQDKQPQEGGKWLKESLTDKGEQCLQHQLRKFLVKRQGQKVH